MPETVTLPLSVLNALPGVSGVEDVEFSIPTPEDIDAIVDEQTPDEEDVRDEVEEAIADVDFEQAVPELADPVQFSNQVLQAAADIDVEDLADELEADIDDVGTDVSIDIDGLFGPTQQDLQSLGDTLLDNLEDVGPEEGLAPGDASLQLLEEVIRGEVTSPGFSRQAAIDELQRRATRPGSDALDLGTAAGALAQDLIDDGEIPREQVGVLDLDGDSDLLDLANPLDGVTKLFGEVTDIKRLLLGDSEEFFKDPTSFFEGIFEAVFPSINGVSFFGDPLEWVLNLGIEVTELAVSEESRQDIEDAVAGFARPADRGDA